MAAHLVLYHMTKSIHITSNKAKVPELINSMYAWTCNSLTTEMSVTFQLEFLPETWLTFSLRPKKEFRIPFPCRSDSGMPVFVVFQTTFYLYACISEKCIRHEFSYLTPIDLITSTRNVCASGWLKFWP